MKIAEDNPEKHWTWAEISDALVRCDLRFFRDDTGSASAETAARMMRLQLAVNLERVLNDNEGPKAA